MLDGTQYAKFSCTGCSVPGTGTFAVEQAVGWVSILKGFVLL